MKIVVLDGYTLNPGDITWAPLEKLGNLIIFDRTPEDEIVSRIGDAEIILTNKTPITAETMAACPNLKYIGVLATGYNIIDVENARSKGIVVANVPGYSTMAVAQLTFAFLLEFCHHVQKHSDSVMAGDWIKSEDFAYWHYPMMELEGKTLGLIGFGQIAKQVARLGRAYGMQVIATRRNNKTEDADIPIVSLEQILAQSDVISLHCPQTGETTGMINAAAINKMKKGALLINTARGGLVVDTDLKKALEAGHLAGYAADVLAKEPMQPEHPLLGVDDVLLTPHIAWAPKQTRIRLMQMTAENLQAYLQGQPKNVVN